MNKKIFTFGILAIFGLMMVSAGLVNYLSNSSQVNVKVSSPLTLETSSTEVDVYGGEVYPVVAKVTNHIAEEVTGVLETTITNNKDNVTCDDFQSITVHILDGSDAGDYDLSYLSGSCNPDGDSVVVSIPVLYIANEVQNYNVDVEFMQNVEPARYYMDSQIMVAP